MRLVAFLGVAVAVAAVIGTVYLIGGRGGPGDRQAGKPAPPTMTATRTPAAPTAGTGARAIPAVSVRRGDDPRALVVEYGVGVGDCYQSLDRAEVTETATSVTVRLVPTPSSKATQSTYCLDQVLLRTTTVGLAEPLGKRQVIDGTTGRTLQVGE